MTTDKQSTVEHRHQTTEGSTVKTYRPFTREELVKIFDHLNKKTDASRQWVINALLCSGGRSGEIIRLRTGDIKKSKAGVYYFDFVHRPRDEYPTSLKGGDAGERRTPLHQRLIDKSYHNTISTGEDGYLMNAYTQGTSSWTSWFRDAILKPLSIYEPGTTDYIHYAIQPLTCGVSQVLMQSCRAFVAHASKDVQDKIYDQGLKNMPRYWHLR